MVPPRIDPVKETGIALVIPWSDYHCRMDFQSQSVPRAIRFGASAEKKLKIASLHFSKEGDKVLVVRGMAFGHSKWPAFKPKDYSP